MVLELLLELLVLSGAVCTAGSWGRMIANMRFVTVIAEKMPVNDRLWLTAASRTWGWLMHKK